ncbi:MAG TPA: hypothetical protein VF928_06300 [Usitatibacteraceae bacterium]
MITKNRTKLLLSVAVFVAVFVTTVMLRMQLYLWLSAFELPDIDGEESRLSLDRFVLLISAAPFVMSFLVGGGILGVIAGNRRTAVLGGLLLGSTFILAAGMVGGLNSLPHRGLGSFWLVVLSWANFLAPIPAAMGGALISSCLKARVKRGQAA